MDRRRSALAALLVLILAAAAAGCARAVAVGSADPRLNYEIEVHNETPVAMVVRYNDGRSDALLGLVDAGRSERFIIASPASTRISVTGASDAGTRTSGPYSVTLGQGTRVSVVLR